MMNKLLVENGLLIRLLIGFAFLLMIIVASMRSYTVVSKPMSAAAYCGIDEVSLAQNVKDDRTEIEVWAPSWGKGCWRGYAIRKAAERIADHDIDVSARTIEAASGGFRNAFKDAAENGTAPDIAWAINSTDLAGWSTAGYIVPLTSCVQKHDEFDHVRDKLWAEYRVQDQIWGVPMEAGIYGLYYDKEKLRELGWSEQEIDAFPEQIRNGQFTLNDLAAVAQQAVQTGVVQPSYGFWPYYSQVTMLRILYRAHGGSMLGNTSQIDKRDADDDAGMYIAPDLLAETYRFAQMLVESEITHPAFGERSSKSWFNRTIGDDTSAHGRTLFWVNQSARRGQDYLNNYESLEDLDNQIGFALIPSISNQIKPIAQLETVEFYVIASKSASGRDGQSTSCDLLAQAVVPEIQALNVALSNRFGVIKEMGTHPAFASSEFMSQITYMWDYTQPQDFNNLDVHIYSNIIQESFVQVVRGNMTPEVAALSATQNLRREIGVNLVPQPAR